MNLLFWHMTNPLSFRVPNPFTAYSIFIPVIIPLIYYSTCPWAENLWNLWNSNMARSYSLFHFQTRSLEYNQGSDYVTSAFWVWDSFNMVLDPLFQTTWGLRTHCFSHFPFKVCVYRPIDYSLGPILAWWVPWTHIVKFVTKSLRVKKEIWSGHVALSSDHSSLAWTMNW